MHLYAHILGGQPALDLFATGVSAFRTSIRLTVSKSAKRWFRHWRANTLNPHSAILSQLQHLNIGTNSSLRSRWAPRCARTRCRNGPVERGACATLASLHPLLECPFNGARRYLRTIDRHSVRAARPCSPWSDSTGKPHTTSLVKLLNKLLRLVERTLSSDTICCKEH